MLLLSLRMHRQAIIILRTNIVGVNLYVNAEEMLGPLDCFQDSPVQKRRKPITNREEEETKTVVI